MTEHSRRRLKHLVVDKTSVFVEVPVNVDGVLLDEQKVGLEGLLHHHATPLQVLLDAVGGWWSYGVAGRVLVEFWWGW